jgi:hypothetical protein
MGIVNIVVTWLALPMSGIGVRLMLHLYDVGQLLAVGLASAFVVLAWKRFGSPRPFVGYGLLAIFSVAISQLVLRNDLCESAPPQSHGIHTPHPEIPILVLNYPLSRSCCLS